jgi:putative tricarboxylic transport membrane protein
MAKNDMPTWSPSQQTELVAGTPPGGGQDRPARILIGILNRQQAFAPPMKLTNIPGRGGGNGWDYLHACAGDPHKLAISSPTVISNKLLGVSALDFTDLTPLANLYTEYPIFIVRPDASLHSADDLLARLKSDTAGVKTAIATAIGNTNHIALARVTAHAGGDVKALSIDVFDSARDAIGHVLEGKAELGVITAASAVPELTAGSLRTIAVSAPNRLGGLFAQAPTWLERGISCDIGMWRGIFAARNLEPAAIAFWTEALTEVTASEEWKAELASKYWTDSFATGANVLAALQREQRLIADALGELDLLPKPQARAVHADDGSADWRPRRELEIVAGTSLGGGLDRVARALAMALAETAPRDVAAKVVNIPGDGARRAWGYIDRHPGDGHVIAISSPNLATDYLTGLADFDHSRYAPIAILLTEYIAFAVSATSPIKTASDLLEKLATDPAGVTVALSTALGNPNHLAFAKLVSHVESDLRLPTIRVFDNALDAVADVVAGNAGVAAVTAASVLPQLTAEKVRILAISSPERLAAPFAQTPTWTERGVDCMIGAWRGVTAPAGIDTGQRAFWEAALKAATDSSSWKAELIRNCWSSFYLEGAALRQYLAEEQQDFASRLAQLGLSRAASPPENAELTPRDVTQKDLNS